MFMKKSLFLFLGALASGQTAMVALADVAALSVVTNGTTLTVGVPEGQEYVFPHRLLDTAITKVVKDGLGTLNLGVVTNTFGGVRPEFEINAGILKGIHGYNNVNGIGGSFGRAKSFKIADGAQLYFLDTMNGSQVSSAHVTTGYKATDGQGGTWIGAASVEVCGAGPDGLGAIRRPHAGPNGGHDLFGVNTTITLTGPTTFGMKSRWGIGGGATLNMNGYDLKLLGDQSFEFARGSKLTIQKPGRFIMDGGPALFENMGTLVYPADNLPTVVVTNAGSVSVYNYTAPFPVETAANASSTVLNLCFQKNTTSTFAGPLYIGGAQVSVKHGNSAEPFVGIISGGITGNKLSFVASGLRPAPIYISGPATNNFSDFYQTRGNVVFQNNSTNVIRNTLLQAGGQLTFTNGVRTTLGSIALRDCAANTVLTFRDAGLVIVTNATQGTSVQSYVPHIPTMSIKVGYASSHEGTNITRLVVAGKTVLGTCNTRPGNTQLADGFIGIANKGVYDRGIVDVREGAVVSNDFFVGGGGQYQAGAIYLSGKESKFISRGTDKSMNWLGRGQSYASFEMLDGYLSHGGHVTIGQQGRGFFVQRGGEVAWGNGTIKLGRTSLGYGHFLQLGGTLGPGPGGLASVTLGYSDAYKDADGYTTLLTVGGREGTPAELTCQEVRSYFVTNKTASAIGTALVNINRGGTLVARQMYREVQAFDFTTAGKLADEATRFFVNFDGGTLKTTGNGKFFNKSLTGEETGQRQPTRVTVYAGGATIDTDGHDVSMIAPFLKPYGKGVAGVTLTDVESLTPGKSIGTRRVRIEGAGLAADVVTDFNPETRGNAAEAIVTCPGFGYTDATTAKVEAYKNYGVTSNATIRLVDFENGYVHGGFTKKGAGTLTLQGANTYGGATRVEGGTLALTHEAGYPGGDLEFPASVVTNTTAPCVVAKTLAFNAGAKIRVTNADELDPNCCHGLQTLVTTETALAALPPVAFVDADGDEVAVSPAWTLRLAHGGKAIEFGYQRGTMMILR